MNPLTCWVQLPFGPLADAKYSAMIWALRLLPKCLAEVDTLGINFRLFFLLKYFPDKL